MKWFLVFVVILLCIACADDTKYTFLQVEDPPERSSIPLIGSGVMHYVYSGLSGKNIPVFQFDSPAARDQIERNPSQDWINGYFKPRIENKQFYNSISFPDDTVAIRLFMPGEDSTLIRQAFISESKILKPIGSGSYSSGYLYPPNKELQISWDFTDSLGTRVAPGWYAFSTEFVAEDRAILFWFYLFE